MRWPWRKEARPIEPRRRVNTKVLELQTAKEILAEVFHARPADVEEMIQRRIQLELSLQLHNLKQQKCITVHVLR